MKNKNFGLYALALAIAFVGALALGLPVGSLFVLAIAVACPLMMFLMMRGHGGEMRGGRDGSDEPDRLNEHDHRTGSSRP